MKHTDSSGLETWENSTGHDRAFAPGAGLVAGYAHPFGSTFLFLEAQCDTFFNSNYLDRTRAQTSLSLGIRF
jgi:hypothetical protein